MAFFADFCIDMDKIVAKIIFMNKTRTYKYYGVVLCLFVSFVVAISLCGCSSPGETPDEISRRHKRVIRNDWLQVQSDADAVMMLDKPSRVSDNPVR